MEKVRWGLIGCGDIARKRVAPALRDTPSSELLAVSRAQSSLAESFAKKFGARRWYADWRELVRDKEIDAIYIATPVHLHLPQTVTAAEAGKHVLCEKPMALNAAECKQMIAACERHKVKLSVAYYRHFYPVIERIRSIIGSGEVGEPVIAQINAFEWFNPEPGDPRAWLINKREAGGGPMLDFGCHRIEVLTNLFGEVDTVRAITAKVLFDREVEDTALASFRFKRGTCATLTVTHAAREPQDTLDVFGSHGSIHLPVLTEGKLRVVTTDGERSESHPAASNIHQPLIEDFVASVLNDRQPRVTGAIGKMVAEIEDEIYETGVSQ